MERSVVGRNAQNASRGIELPDRYRSARLIGVGGMATIWVAEDDMLKRRVAVKVLAEQYAEQQTFVERFEREARTAAALSAHPHIVTIFDVGTHDGRPFIVMEHLSGGSFADRMTAGRATRADVLRWLTEAASALDYAHEHGVVHRDVKPRNLLFDELGRLVVADFGIARAAHEEQLTVSGELLGTAAYISPEQTVGEQATPASDRYALAVVAYEALTGGLPFGTGTLMEIATRRTQMDPPRASERAPGLSPVVDDVLLRGLAREPSQRWDSATGFVKALEAAAGAERELPTARVTTPPPPPPQFERASRRPPVAAILLGVVAAVVGLIVGITLLNGDNGSTPRADRKQERRAKPERSAQPERTQTAQKDQAPPPTQTKATGASLNDQGFALMQSGRYGEAIPVLQRAVAGFPEGSTDVTLAYALYNLGRSLRLAGRPAEAIPVLERRLQFNNQRGAVKKELKAAQREARGGAAGDEGD